MSTEAQREAARKRQANKRAREKGLPEPYEKIDKAAIADRKAKNAEDLLWAQGQDATGTYYKSECRSCVDLLAIYEGAGILEKEDEEEDDEETGRRTKAPKGSKKSAANPSIQRIQIPEFDRGFDDQGNPKLDSAVDAIVDFQEWLGLRDKARKDLYWLCKLLGKDLYPDVHQIICDKFVQKNFDGMYHKGYTLGDFHRAIDAQTRVDEIGTPTKEMMLLESRGFYKSTINGIDCVQWFINCPDVHIFIITGEYKLAVQFLQEIKDYFYMPKGSEATAFHLLFPEYLLTGVAGTSKQPMKCPARILKQKGNSLWVNAIVANLSGWHCDVKKGDDIVTDENSNTEDARETIKIKYDGTDDLLDPHGFSDHIGTRYFTDDWYGTRLIPDKESGDLAPILYHKRGCWTLKPEYRDIPLTRLTEDMVTLTFPQVATFKKLRQKLLKKGERFFRNQQLNEPTDSMEDSGFKLSFNIDILRAHSYPAESAPKVGDIYQSWDWSYSDRKTSDYSVGVTAMVYQRPDGEYALCILEIVFDKWKASELVYKMISFYKKWNPKRVLIEKALGADLLELALKAQAGRLGCGDFIDKIFWLPVSTKANAKKNRIKSLETLLDDDRLHFVNGNWIDETFKQLTRYTGENSTSARKDDIPDGMAFLIEFLPKSALKRDVDPEEAEQEAEIEKRKAMAKAFYQRMFPGQAPTAQPVAIEEEPQPDPRRAGMSKIFGGNGLRA